jgi:hypothetical protein
VATFLPRTQKVASWPKESAMCHERISLRDQVAVFVALPSRPMVKRLNSKSA